MVARGELVEWAEVHGHAYGTPRKSLVRGSQGGRHVVLDIDVQGATQIREAVPQALLLFILPPSMDVMLQAPDRSRDRGRRRDPPPAQTAVRELEAARIFDFFVINDDLERAVQEVRILARTRPASGGRASPGPAPTPPSSGKRSSASCGRSRLPDSFVKGQSRICAYSLRTM